MARNLAVRNEWQPADLPGRDIAQTVPTMAGAGDVDFRGMLRSVYRRKWTLLLIMLASMGASIVWARHATPHYSADVLIVVEPRPSSIVPVTEPVQNAISDRAYVDTEVAVLRSRTLAARTIGVLGLENDPEFDPKGLARSRRGAGSEATRAPADGRPLDRALEALGSLASKVIDQARRMLASAWAGSEDAGSRAAQPAADDLRWLVSPDLVEAQDKAVLLKGFLDKLSVESDEGSRLIRIGFTSRDPEKAARVANTLVQEYMKSQLETKTAGVRRAAEWLETRLSELGVTVRALEKDVQDQRAQTGTENLDNVSQRLAQLNVSLAAAQTQAAAASARYQQARAVVAGSGRADALPDVIAALNIQALRTKRDDLLARLSQLRSSFGERHPMLIETEAELSEVERSLARQVGDLLTGMRNEMERAAGNVTALRSEVDSATREMFKLKAADAAVGQRVQHLEANRELYRHLLERYTETVALRDNQQPDARIISAAQVPLDPSFPNVPKIMVLSFVGSTSLAAVFLVVAERLRQRFDTLETVERHVGLPVIGAIPDLPRLSRMRTTPFHYLQRHPLSLFGRSLRRLHALLALTNDRQMPRTVLITSAAAGEGKTTIAVSLALSAVMSGDKVLLVDCNLVRPQVHRLMEVGNTIGLTDVLRGAASLEEAITRVDGYPLAILPAGQARSGGADLMTSRRMDQLLSELTKTFDVIILDSPPANEAAYSLILGGLAEKTILVTRREWTTQRMATYAANQLELSGAAVAGVVFNGASAADELAVR
jgi:succinoglycan biosynthesis transport protein ExoP